MTNKQDIPLPTPIKFRNGEHLCHKNGDAYIVVETPEEGLIIEATLQPAYGYRKLKPKNPMEARRKWIRPQTEMEDGRFVSLGFGKAPLNPCGEMALPEFRPDWPRTMDLPDHLKHMPVVYGPIDTERNNLITKSGQEILQNMMDDPRIKKLMLSDTYGLLPRPDEAKGMLTVGYGVKPKAEVSPLMNQLMDRAGIREFSLEGFEGIMTEREVDEAAKKAIEFGYDGEDLSVILDAIRSIGINTLTVSDAMGNTRPNILKVERRADRMLAERKEAPVSAVSAAPMTSGDSGSMLGGIVDAAGEIVSGALDSVGNVCSGVDECLSGIGDGL